MGYKFRGYLGTGQLRVWRIVGSIAARATSGQLALWWHSQAWVPFVPVGDALIGMPCLNEAVFGQMWCNELKIKR